MSLINEALKKAQQDVHGGDSPAARHPGITLDAGSARAGRGRVVVLIALLVVVAGAGAYWYLGEDAAPEPPVPVVVRPVVPSQEVVVTTVSDTKIEPVSVPTPVVSAVTLTESVPVVAPAPVVDLKPVVEPTLPPAPSVVVMPVAVEPVAAPAVVLGRSPEVAAMIDLMRVTLGVVRTGRCVVDGIVFKVGDTITTDPLITVKSVGDTSVSFADAKGHVYEKKYR